MFIYFIYLALLYRRPAGLDHEMIVIFTLDFYEILFELPYFYSIQNKKISSVPDQTDSCSENLPLGRHQTRKDDSTNQVLNLDYDVLNGIILDRLHLKKDDPTKLVLYLNYYVLNGITRQILFTSTSSPNSWLFKLRILLSQIQLMQKVTIDIFTKQDDRF